VWALDRLIPSAERNASRPRCLEELGHTYLSRIQPKGKATRHLDSPTDGGLEYLISGNPQRPCLNHSLQFKHALTSSYGTFAMDVSDSSAESWLDIAQTMDAQQDLSSRSQNEDEIVKSNKAIEDPICLFAQFVSAVTPDALKDIQPQSEVS
jgi:hypothetical protein